MTTFYLHIGTFKTGTTSLQYFLYKNKDELLKKGFLYPLSVKPDSKPTIEQEPCIHCSLHWELNPKKYMFPFSKNGRTWQEILTETELIKPENVIISSEVLSRLNYQEISQVKAKIESYPTKIIVYLRKQDDFLASLYSQHFKTGIAGGSFSEYCQMIELNNIIKGVFNDYRPKFKDSNSLVPISGDYYELLEPWKEIFGKENIIVRIFEKNQWVNNNLIEDFLTSIDFPVDDETREIIKQYKPRNIAPNNKNINLINSLNKIFRDKLKLNKKLCANLYRKPLQSDNPLSRFTAKLPDFIISNDILSQAEKNAIMKELEESNAKVAKEYLHREDGKLFS